jgi:ribosome-associated protein
MRVPLSEIRITFVRSQGPGGQNVNKTSSKAQLRWHVWESKAFSTEEKNLIVKALAPYLTWRGEVIISSEQTRSQSQNKALAIRRLQTLVAKAVIPAKARVATKPTKASKLRRLESKIKHAKKKKGRRFIDLFFF